MSVGADPMAVMIQALDSSAWVSSQRTKNIASIRSDAILVWNGAPVARSALISCRFTMIRGATSQIRGKLTDNFLQTTAIAEARSQRAGRSRRTLTTCAGHSGDCAQRRRHFGLLLCGAKMLRLL